MNPKIFLYGVPGSGKTQYSHLLGKQYGLPVIEGDVLRDKAKSNINEQDFPFLFMGTCQAWKKFGELTKDNAIKGLLAVRSAMRQPVEKEIANRDSFVLEAAFLNPTSLYTKGRTILLVVPNEKLHREHFLKHRETSGATNEEFLAARMIQSYLVEEARRLGVEVIEND